MKMNYSLTKILIFSLFIVLSLCENKYSKSANEKKKNKVDFRSLEKPYRMNKLNILWTKAQHRLTEPKLQSLYSDLMIQDKEELTLKRLKSDGGDKEGFREAEIRRKLTNIMKAYGLLEHFEENALPKNKEHPAFNSAMDDHINRSLFKDKKLNMLWAKAESSGFTTEELQALKEEFQHHQEKIDQYYQLLEDWDKDAEEDKNNNVLSDDIIKYNEIMNADNVENMDKNIKERADLVREKHMGLRDGYEKLHRMAARGPNNREFIEPKVQGLWKMAIEGNFSPDELASLKVELQHYESRLLKLRHLQADHVSNKEKYRSQLAGDKGNLFEEQQQMIKKHSRKITKMHDDLENRILQRVEL